MLKSSDKDLGDKYWEICSSEVVMLPNIGDYLAYNEIIYQYMARDTLRQEAYEQAIRQNVKDKVVVEIGPGSQLIWTLICVEAGVRKIYAIEENETAYHAAKQLAQQKGVSEKIELIQGLSTDVNLPEKADVCISEIIGCIGNSEGVARYLNDAKRFLKPNGIMIPAGCLTLLSPGFKPEVTYWDDFLEEVLQDYQRNISKKLGKEFKITRYYIHNFPKSNLIGSPQSFEEMWFNDEVIAEEFDKTLTFPVEKSSPFDGLVLWIKLYVDSEAVLDTLNQTTSWEPLYIPMEPFSLEKGDVIEVRCRSKVSANQANPDYFFESLVKRGDEVVYRCLRESGYA